MRNNQKEVPYLKKKKDEITIRSSAAEYLTYVASVGDQQDSIEMRYEDENIWLTQKMMATLYDVDVRTVNEHIKKIYLDSELEEDSTIRNFRIVELCGIALVGGFCFFLLGFAAMLSGVLAHSGLKDALQRFRCPYFQWALPGLDGETRVHELSHVLSRALLG